MIKVFWKAGKFTGQHVAVCLVNLNSGRAHAADEIGGVNHLPGHTTHADKLREDSKGDKRVSAPLDAPTAAWVLEPLQMAAASSSPKLVEPALGCLHKLVRVSV